MTNAVKEAIAQTKQKALIIASQVTNGTMEKAEGAKQYLELLEQSDALAHQIAKENTLTETEQKEYEESIIKSRAVQKAIKQTYQL